MSRIACVWADLGDDAAANQWYEDTHIPAAVAQLDVTARNAERAEDNMFKEVPGIDGASMTVYDLPSKMSLKEVEAQNEQALGKSSEPTRVETRIYTEYASWLGEDFRNGRSG